MDMPSSSGVKNILMDLMQQVDTENPITKEVTLKLNEFADAVISGGPEVRESALDSGAYAIVSRAWIYCCYSGSTTNTLAPGAKQCRNAVLTALFALTPGNPEIIDDVGWQIIMQAVDKTLPESTLVLVLKLLRNVFIKSEDNREQFCWYLDMLDPLLSLTARPRISNQFLLEWCSALKALILNDDEREAFNRASERKKAIASARVLPNLASRLNLHSLVDDESDVEAMNAIVILLGSMAVNDELCLSMETGNVVPGIHNLFKHRADNKTLMRNTVSLLRNLCVCPDIRDRVSTYALMKYIVDMLSEFQKEKEMVEVILYCCAYMTLKNACQVSQFIAKGGLQVTLQVMTDNSTNVNILKPGCLTLRNVVENGDDGKDKMKDIGFHVFLSSLMTNMQQLTAFYLFPILKYMNLSSTSFLEDEAHYSGPENVLLEPQLSRRSVVIDED